MAQRCPHPLGRAVAAEAGRWVVGGPLPRPALVHHPPGVRADPDQLPGEPELRDEPDGVDVGGRRVGFPLDGHPPPWSRLAAAGHDLLGRRLRHPHVPREHGRCRVGSVPRRLVLDRPGDHVHGPGVRRARPLHRQPELPAGQHAVVGADHDEHADRGADEAGDGASPSCRVDERAGDGAPLLAARSDPLGRADGQRVGVRVLGARGHRRDRDDAPHHRLLPRRLRLRLRHLDGRGRGDGDHRLPVR